MNIRGVPFGFNVPGIFFVHEWVVLILQATEKITENIHVQGVAKDVFSRRQRIFFSHKKKTNSIIQISIMKITNAVILFIATISISAQAKIIGSEEKTSRKLWSHGWPQCPDPTKTMGMGMGMGMATASDRVTCTNIRTGQRCDYESSSAAPGTRTWSCVPARGNGSYYPPNPNRPGPGTNRQRNFQAWLTPTANSVSAPWCDARSPARGELNTSSNRFCVYVTNLSFRPTSANIRGGNNFSNKQIDCSRGTECRSCYTFSGQEISQLNRGQLRVVVSNTNNQVCRISGDLRQS